MATKDIDVSNGGKLLARYLQVTSCLDNNKIAFDAWISKIGEQFEIKVEEVSPGIFVIFTPVSIIPPVGPDENSSIITPTIAREQKLNYTSEIKTHIKIVRNFDPKDPCSGEIIEQTTKPISVGKIHTMVKCVLCRLNGKSASELEAMSEDPRDPGGYMIVNGLSRVAPFNQQMRVNTFVMSADSSREPHEPVCTITADTIRGTVITSARIVYTKIQGSPMSIPEIRLNLNNIRKKISTGGKKRVYYTFNVIRAIRYFATINIDNVSKSQKETLILFQDPEYIFNFILKLSKEEWRKKTKLILLPTYIESLARSDDEDAIASLIHSSSGDVGADLSKGIRYTINSSIVTYEDSENYVGRVKTLCMMAAMLAEYESGYRKLTNRDAWRNKRLITLAKKTAQLLRGHFKIFTRTALSRKKGENFSKSSNLTLQSIISNASHSHVTEGFQSSFTGPRWGVGTVNTREENPVNDLQMGSFLEMIAMLVRLNTTVDRKTKSFQLRGVQPDQWGYVDAHDSPESSAIGLVLELSITTSITIEKSASGVISILNGEIGVVLIEDDPPYVEKYIYDDEGPEHKNIVLVNGFFKGWCNGRKTLRALRFGKRQGLFDRQSCIVINEYGYLIIHTDEGRLVRPLLIIDENDDLVIEKKNMWNSPIRELFEKGCVEYVDAHEQVYARIAELPESLEKWKESKEHFQEMINLAEIQLSSPNLKKKDLKQLEKDLAYAKYELKILQANPFTHREIHPQAMFAPSLTTMPFLEYNQITRVSYQSHMAKQAVGTYSTEYERRFEDSKVLMRPSKPLVTTQLEPFLGLDKYPHGKMLEFAFLAIRGTTQEDAMVMNENTISSGLLSMMTFISVETCLDTNEMLGLPTKFKENEDPIRYQYLTNQGLPMINAPLYHGDFVIGKIQITKDGEKNLSIPLKVGQSGIVHRVFVTKYKTKHAQTRIVVVLRRDREQQIGDKVSSRFAQKGTVSEIVPQKDLPFFEVDGTVPDIFVNPHSVPKRMTVGYIKEAVYGLLSAVTGKRINASPFEPNTTDEVYAELEKNGFKSKGYRWMVDPISGMRLKAMVFSGPIYIQLLSHLGPEKLQVRASGAVKMLTRQPPRGGFIGGRRVGEMERDAILSHGASNFLYERLITMSDEYVGTFCVTCGDFANFIISGDTGRGICGNCGKDGDVRKKIIPYVYKLLVQLLLGAHIRIRFDPDKINKVKRDNEDNGKDEEDEEDEEDEDDGVVEIEGSEEEKEKDESDAETEEEFESGGDSEEDEDDDE